MFVMFLGLFVSALLSPAGKELTSWLLFVMFYFVLPYPIWYPRSGVLLVCIPILDISTFLTLRKLNLLNSYLARMMYQKQ